ncbi:hypothetical protein Tco_1071783 [Tanacetum coccineum]
MSDYFRKKIKFPCLNILCKETFDNVWDRNKHVPGCPFRLIREREGRQEREAMAFVQGDGDGEGWEGQVVADEPDSDGTSDSSVELRMHKANKITKKKLKKLKKKQKAAA